MDPMWVGVIGIIVLLTLIAFGAHIAIALGLTGAVGLIFVAGIDGAVASLASLAHYKVASFSLTVIPLFVMMGMLASESGVTSKLFNVLQLWTGRLRASLSVATAAGCTVFGTVCGSSLVTAALFAKTAAPEMRQRGYDKKFSYAICSAAGTIGMLIPPSILIVIYGINSGDSIAKLLIGGITPGLLLFIVFSIGSIVMAYLNPSLAPAIRTETTWGQRLKSLPSFWPFVLMMGIIVGGLFSGLWSPEETGAVGALFMFLIFIGSRQRSWQRLKSAMFDTIATSAMIFLILIGGGLFARFLTMSGVTTSFLNLVVGSGLEATAFVIAAAGVYIALGCFFDGISMTVITLPIFYPVVTALGIDPIYFAMVAILAMHVGPITPPVGLNVYAVKGVAEADVSLEDLFRGVMPYFIMMLVALAIIIAFPAMSTYLPNLMVN